MKVAPIERSLEGARAAYDKASAAVEGTRNAVVEDALAIHDMPGVRSAVDAFYDAVRVLSAAAADGRRAAVEDAKDAFDTSRVELPFPWRCEPSTDGRYATPGASRDGGHALSREPSVLRDSLQRRAGMCCHGAEPSPKTRPLIHQTKCYATAKLIIQTTR